MSAAVSEVAVAEVMTPDALAPALAGLEPSTARQLREAFVPALVQIEEWERQARELTVTDETQTAKMKMAGVMRKELKRVRVGVEKRRKELNADALARTKAINGAAHIIEGLIVPLESHLRDQELFAERAEAARRDALREARSDALRAYGTDPSAYADLGAASEETWASILETARVAHEAKLEAERQAEAVRIEAEKIAAAKREAERQERIRLEAERAAREQAQAEENARLKREAEEREAAAKAERDRVEAERAAERAKAKAEADAREAAARAEREAVEAEARKAREEADRVAAELEAERQRAADEERRRQEEEAARAAAEQAAREAAALAPDKVKLAAFAATLRGIEVPAMSTAKGQATAKRVAEQIAKLAAWVDKSGEALS